ncbi:hypothetical protein GGI07_004308 [Coemansia sp. Benny D115]|nr:hypothetical protein GGI07_004308 [Coemansia sp. Benny D115]
MVSYTDLSPLKQPDAPVEVDLNAPVPLSDWHGRWLSLHSKTLYFSNVAEDALPELQKLFKASRGIRLNVDPHESMQITGSVEFRNVYDTEKAMVVLNNRALQHSSSGPLLLTPLPDHTPLDAPPRGGYVCIKHVPDEATESTLYDFLRPSGPMYSCSFPVTNGVRRKGVAHVCFTDESYAQNAIEQLNFAEYMGNTISIQMSRPPRRASKAEQTKGAKGHRANKPSVSQTDSAEQPVAEAEREKKKKPEQPTERQQQTPSPAAPPAPSQPQQPQPQPLQQQQQQQQSAHSRQPSQSLYRSPPEPLSGSSISSSGAGNGLGGVIVPGKLFVTNLHPTVSHKELFALFKKYGYIQSARVSIDPATKKSRGHGIVQFSNPTSALDALRECQGADIKGRKITMYQYEHVNKNPAAADQAADHAPDQPVRERAQSSQHSTVPFPRPLSSASSTGPTPISAPVLTTSTAATAAASAAAVPATANPAPPISAPQIPAPETPFIDPVMLRNLSEMARNEILTQKLVSEIAANPAVDVRDSAHMVASFIQRPLEDILALLSDPRLLASEWDLEKKAAAHLPAGMGGTPTVPDSPVSQQSSSPRATRSEGIHLPDYDTTTEEYIEMLLSKPENERKKKLGSRLFPLIKGMGYKESTKLTVWILDHMSHDVRSLAYMLNDTTRLCEVVEEAQQSIICK